MLLEMNIKNFVIIKNETIRFEDGLNIITGETGSGKSLIIDCINAIAGGKLNKDQIRIGESKAIIETVFYIDNSEIINQILEQYGIIKDELNNLIIVREINDSGRSLCRINGQSVTLSVLKVISKHLFDIIGQNEHQLLLNPSNHIEYIDIFQEDKIKILKAKLGEYVSNINNIRQKLDKIYGNKSERERKLDLLKYQIDEIDSAKLMPDEEDILKNRKGILINAEKIFSNISDVYTSLYKNANNSCIIDRLGLCLDTVNNMTIIDTNLEPFKLIIESALYSLDEMKNELRNYKDNIEFNEVEINQIEERLDLLNKLKRKYGNSISEILEYRDSISGEYSDILNSEQVCLELQSQLENELKEYKKYALILSKERTQASKLLQKAIEHVLHELNMKGSEFIISMTKEENLISCNGFDKINFLLSANPGEPPKPLHKIASGGEISRVLLAIRCCINNKQNISSMVFDEVDSGIGGVTSDIVGQKLKSISKINQTICITHLPQIASYADHHIKIYKTFIKDKTYTKIVNLSYEEKINEIAQMLSGNENSGTSYQHAKELIERKRLS